MANDEYTDEDFEDVDLSVSWPDEGPANFTIKSAKGYWHTTKQGPNAGNRQPALQVVLEPLGWEGENIFHTCYLGANAGKKQLEALVKAATGSVPAGNAKPPAIATLITGGLVNAPVKHRVTEDGNIEGVNVDGFKFKPAVLDDDDDDEFGIS